MRALARAVSETLEEMKIPHAMKGGTALKISKGLTRPSTDVDFEIESSRDAEEVIRRAFEKIPGWEEVKVPRQMTMGIGTEISAKRKGSDNTVKTKLDLVPVGTFDKEDKDIPRDRTVSIEGIRIWTFEELAERKLRALVGKQRRKEARDVYDAAYLMENHPEVIREETWSKLEQWIDTILKNKREKQAWTRRFERDDVMKRTSIDDVLRSMTRSRLEKTRVERKTTERTLAQKQASQNARETPQGKGVKYTPVTESQVREAAKRKDGEGRERVNEREGDGARAGSQGIQGGYGE